MTFLSHILTQWYLQEWFALVKRRSLGNVNGVRIVANHLGCRGFADLSQLRLRKTNQWIAILVPVYQSNGITKCKE